MGSLYQYTLCKFIQSESQYSSRLMGSKLVGVRACWHDGRVDGKVGQIRTSASSARSGKWSDGLLRKRRFTIQRLWPEGQ